MRGAKRARLRARRNPSRDPEGDRYRGLYAQSAKKIRRRQRVETIGALAAAAAVGAVGFIAYSMSHRSAAAGAMPAQDIAANGIGGAGAGLVVGGGIVGIFEKKTLAGIISALAGIALLYTGMKLDTATPSTAITPAATA